MSTMLSEVIAIRGESESLTAGLRSCRCCGDWLARGEHARCADCRDAMARDHRAVQS